MPDRSFAVTYDYRCPFARIAAEHVVTGLRAGAPWTVSWRPFSLSQAHVEEGDPPVWERPEIDSGLLALEVASAVEELAPERFVDVHRDLFDVREPTWVGGPPGAGEAITVRVRHRHAGAAGTVAPLEGGGARVTLDALARAITPGQAAVFYRGAEVVGGGWIAP